MQRVDFRLPRFTRVGWASEQARKTWEPRVAAVAAAWQTLEWRSVAEGLRETALLFTDVDALVSIAARLAELGLLALPVERRPEPARLVVAIGPAPAALRLREAVLDGDDEAVGALLGYPDCCRAAFARRWNDEGFVDLVWPMAISTPGASRQGGGLCTLAARMPTNVLLRRLGVRAVFHLPCHFGCEASERLGLRHLERLGSGDAGEAEPVGGWARQMLSWPVEWSVLHGIAEVKTPVLRLIADSDAATSKHVVRMNGVEIPREAARGTAFPFALEEERGSGLPVLH